MTTKTGLTITDLNNHITVKSPHDENKIYDKSLSLKPLIDLFKNFKTKYNDNN